MIGTDPNWLPPPDEPIGIESARHIIAWVRDTSPPVLAEAEAVIRARYLKATPEELGRSRVPVKQLATWRLGEDMDAVSIGCVTYQVMPTTFAYVDIMITREGQLVARPGHRMRD